MITPTQYTRTYEAHQRVLHNEAQRIARSGETRSWLNKNAAVDRQTVEMALQCIGDLTGDYTAIKNFGRTHEQTGKHSKCIQST